MRSELPTARSMERVAGVTRRLLDAQLSKCLLLDGQGVLIGIVRPSALAGQPDEATVDAYCKHDTMVFDENTSLSEVMEQLRGFTGEAATVISSTCGRLLGTAPEGAIIEAYLDRVRALRREENEAP